MPEYPDDVVRDQAGDPALWFQPVHITEDYLQTALRRLHAAVELKSPGQCVADTFTRCIPPNPEQEGYHWVRRYRGAPAIPLAWFPEWHKNAGRGWGQYSQPEREDQWDYVGPCPYPESLQPTT